MERYIFIREKEIDKEKIREREREREKTKNREGEREKVRRIKRENNLDIFILKFNSG